MSGDRRDKREERGGTQACLYLGDSCVEGGRGGGGRVEKEVESSTTRVGATLEGLEKPLKEEREKASLLCHHRK